MMKPLNQLTNTEKAKLLHRLFPLEIPGLLDHIQNVCQDLSGNEGHYRENWEVGFFNFDAWLKLALETEALICKLRDQMIGSCNVFSEQLCFSYTVIFVNDQIVKYADRYCRNEKFKLAVELLYL